MQQQSSATNLLIGEVALVGDQVSTLPLTQIRVDGQIVGTLGSIALTQRFANPFRDAIEVVYRFAIPHRAALAGLEIQVGGRHINGQIGPREETERAYRDAVDAGKVAAITAEERPNLYTVRIGNARPGEAILATYRYSVPVECDGGRFEVALPFGVTPRYHSPSESPGRAAATDVPIAAPGAPIADLDITLAVDAGVAIDDPQSPSHHVEVTRLDDRRCLVKLVDPRVPNKDFILRYSAREEAGKVLSAVWRTAAPEGDVVYAVFVPPAPDEAHVDDTPREYVFILDRSGSMSGAPIAQARNALRAALRTLAPKDTFRILLFDNVIEWWEPSRRSPVAFADTALAAADAFLAEVEGRGGTEILSALQAALELPDDRARRRVIVLLTDGAVSAEEEAARLVKTMARQQRLFCFGIGPSVNRLLLDRLARDGRGAAEVVGLDEDIEGAIIRFQDRMSYPVLSDLTLNVHGAAPVEAYPSPLPDLHAGQALHAVMRLAPGAGPISLGLRGKRGVTDVTLPVESPRQVDEPLIRRLWAQRKIDALLENDGGEPSRDAIVALSRNYLILTPFTALLAVDTVAGRTDRPARRVLVASPLPEGLTFGPNVPAKVAGPALSSVRMKLFGVSGHRGGGGSARARAYLAEAMPSFAPPARQVVDAVHDWDEQAVGPDEMLRELARTQRATGAWGDNGESVELTAAALVAFARVGQTPRIGIFRRQLARAVRWLTSNARTPLERPYLLWAQGEIGLADGDNRAVEAAVKQMPGVRVSGDRAIVDAIAARLRAIQAGAPGSVQQAGWSSDPRIAAIAWRAASSGADALPVAWRACF